MAMEQPSAIPHQYDLIKKNHLCLKFNSSKTGIWSVVDPGGLIYPSTIAGPPLMECLSFLSTLLIKFIMQAIRKVGGVGNLSSSFPSTQIH